MTAPLFLWSFRLLPRYLTLGLLLIRLIRFILHLKTQGALRGGSLRLGSQEPDISKVPEIYHSHKVPSSQGEEKGQSVRHFLCKLKDLPEFTPQDLLH